MTRVGRFIRDMLERWLSRYHEGPQPPKRIGEEVAAFRLVCPNASADEWADFARRLGEKCYEQGYVRGFEWTERELGHRDPATDPEVIAEQARHAWSLAEDNARMVELLREGDPNDPLRGVPSEARAAFFDQVGLRASTHRVVVVDEGPPRPDYIEPEG